MADNKDGREKQADDDARRQRERDIDAELARGDEPEPPIPDSELEAFEAALESLSFPETGAGIVAAVGDREIASDSGTHTVADLIPDADVETFESPAAVRKRVQRPTAAGALKRIAEAVAELPNEELGRSQRDAFERTFLELAAIDAVDYDQGIRVVADWTVDQIREREVVPGSREIRRRAATYCRDNGYEVSNDEWLGI
ncbi:hypothetical protein C461_01951 [Halorubrum aidingense JCM 13560]|uniref:Uncharacterized protein n=1 Tax=Halorubrum aidingense JCM 13560 TaxID=1230454 RepID=M0PIW6_9EURY|nr:hypothetical protein [Halorubrum aidingense]EMA69883.1 hypothetical protein C461_01951 [Halorubrum aidingense JCM 13560]